MAANTTTARIADALTALRFVLSAPIVWATASGRWLVVGVMLAASWLTDFFDGRLARRGGGGRLGARDLDADTLIGAAVVLGLAVGGWLHLVPLLFAACCGVGYVFLRNVALAMFTQAVGYGGALWWMYHERSAGLVVAVATIAFVGVFDASRLRHHVLPAFFAGLRRGQVLGRADR